MKKPATKTCERCRTAQPLSVYYPLGVSGGTHPFCPECLNAVYLEKERARRESSQVRLRTCAQCDQAFPLECFHWIKATRVHHSYCRACHSSYMAIRYLRKKAGRRKLRSAGGWTGT